MGGKFGFLYVVLRMEGVWECGLASCKECESWELPLFWEKRGCGYLVWMELMSSKGW